MSSRLSKFFVDKQNHRCQNEAMDKEKKKQIAIIGGGPAGVTSAIFAAQNPKNDVTVFEQGEVLKTLLYTGGGRCNLAYAEFDFKELAHFYPRGEKFLYSLFSRFSTSDTIAFFENIGVNTYVQPDSRVFPSSDSAKQVRQALLCEMKNKNVKIKQMKVDDIEKNADKFTIKGYKQTFDAVIFSTGGKGNGHSIAKRLGHKITKLKPALCALVTKESFTAALAGISLQNVSASVSFDSKILFEQRGDLLFTHKGFSGPLAYKISSYAAFVDYSKNNPLKIELNLASKTFENMDSQLIEQLNANSKKDLINIVSSYIPKNLAKAIISLLGIDETLKAPQVTKLIRQKLAHMLCAFPINAISTVPQGEVVTAGGVDLNEVDNKTMQSKIVEGLYFCGEILDIDGLTGGFNLQNCWSSGYVAGSALSNY